MYKRVEQHKYYKYKNYSKIMYKLINFAVKLMERENEFTESSEYLPSQNPMINPNQNPNWKKYQWKLFKETILWEYLNHQQKLACQRYLQSLQY